MKTVLVISADEKPNAGMRDYMIALAGELQARGVKLDENVAVLKVGGNGDVVPAATRLPINNNEYAALPNFTVEALHDLHDDVLLIALGDTTFDTAMTAKKYLQDKGDNVSAAYVTHMVTDRKQLHDIVEEHVALYAPVSRDSLRRLDETDAEIVDLHILDAVPHTNTQALSEIEYKKFMASEHGDTLRHIQTCGEPFAVVIANAGWDDKELGRVSYTIREAYSQGLAMGRDMIPNTNLIISHGSPRNLGDDAYNGDDTMQYFINGYKHGQLEQGAEPVIVKAPFTADYNAVKAGYIFAQDDNCVAFVSNSEGYGTMDGARLLLNNDKIRMFMFPFDAHETDKSGQRQANIRKYMTLGIDLAHVSLKGCRLSFERAADRQKTPVPQRNPASQIVSELKLAEILSSAPLPSRKPPVF